MKRNGRRRDLVGLRVAINDAVARLATFPWDSDTELVTLTRTDALRVLQRYRGNALTAAECRHWAESLEGRDDLGLDAGFEDPLKEFLFEIASPELTEPLTDELAARWEAALRTARATEH